MKSGPREWRALSVLHPEVTMRLAASLVLVLALPASAQIAPVTTQISPAEAHNIQVSADGGHVIYDHSFLEAGAWLTAVYDYDRLTGATTELVRSPVPPANHETLMSHGGTSADGRFVIYAGGLAYTGGGMGGPVYNHQVMLLDRLTGLEETISLTPAGAPCGGSAKPRDISGAGRFVLFTTFASDILPGDDTHSLDLFRRDRLLGVTDLISTTVDGKPISDNDIYSASISDDGALVVFSSDAYNLSAGSPNRRQVFLRDMTLGVTVVISETAAGVDADGHCDYEQISADGRYVTFRSFASNLALGGDTNNYGDVFVKDLVTGALERVSVSSHGLETDDQSNAMGISKGGRFVLFESYATNLVPGDNNGAADVFLRDRWAGITRRVSVASDGDDFFPAVGGSISGGGKYAVYQKATLADFGGFPCCSPAFLHRTMAGGPLLTVNHLVAGATATLEISGATPAGVLLVGWSPWTAGCLAEPVGPPGRRRAGGLPGAGCGWAWREPRARRPAARFAGLRGLGAGDRLQRRVAEHGFRRVRSLSSRRKAFPKQVSPLNLFRLPAEEWGQMGKFSTGMQQGASQRMQQGLSAHMLPALAILELASTDLSAYLREAFESNEALTLDEPRIAGPARREATDRHSDWLASQPARTPSLAERLTEELAFRNLGGPDAAELESWCRFLIGELDAGGLLPADDDALLLAAKTRGLHSEDPVAVLEASIAILAGLGPAGVASRSPVEALLAQLDPNDPDTALMEHLFGDFLEELGANKLPAVAAKLGIEVAELGRLIARAGELSTRPLESAASGDALGAPAILPEVLVEEDPENPGTFTVRVDGAAWPCVGLDEDLSALATDPATEVGLRRYLRGRLEEARLVVSAVEQRRTTLLRVSRSLFAHQRAFLEHGPGHLSPLRQEDLASLVGVHRSTVSRATAGKYAWTPWGIFPLKHFFQSAAGSSDAAARDDVRAVLGRLVESEDPARPFSDEELVTGMQERGFILARRTVAKYRRELGIPSSYRRRRYVA